MWDVPALVIQGSALAALIGILVLAFRLVTSGAIVPGRWYERALQERDALAAALADATAAAQAHAASVEALSRSSDRATAAQERLATAVERQSATIERLTVIVDGSPRQAA